MTRIKIFNTYVDNLSMNETVERIDSIVQEKIPTQHVVINALKVNLMNSDNELKEIVNSCPLINADGASILLAGKIFGTPIKERVAGIDLFQELLILANKKKYKIYLFGAKDEVVKKVSQIISKNYPQIVIAGYRNGYFNDKESESIVSEIRNLKPDLMFVGFSSPKKEYWINKYLKDLNVPFVMGVGGTFDVMAGVTSRAPRWMQKLGMEWFHRFIQEPKRMFKRYIFGNLNFLRLIFMYKLGIKKR